MRCAGSPLGGLGGCGGCSGDSQSGLRAPAMTIEQQYRVRATTTRHPQERVHLLPFALIARLPLIVRFPPSPVRIHNTTTMAGQMVEPEGRAALV